MGKLINIWLKNSTNDAYWASLGKWKKLLINDERVLSVCIPGLSLFAQPPIRARIFKMNDLKARQLVGLYNKFSSYKKIGSRLLLVPKYYEEGTPGLVWLYSAARRVYIPIQEGFYDYIINRFWDATFYWYRARRFIIIYTSHLTSPFNNGIVGVIREFKTENVNRLQMPAGY